MCDVCTGGCGQVRPVQRNLQVCDKGPEPTSVEPADSAQVYLVAKTLRGEKGRHVCRRIHHRITVFVYQEIQ